jgi:small subunit ribosomal protein S20
VPNKKAAEKSVRQSKKRAIRNKNAKSAVHTYIRKVRQAVEEKKLDEAKAILPKAIKVLNKTSQKGILHWKKAARLQSRLVKNVNALIKSSQTDKTPSTPSS